jgi:hypothetical protein
MGCGGDQDQPDIAGLAPAGVRDTGAHLLHKHCVEAEFGQTIFIELRQQRVNSESLAE